MANFNTEQSKFDVVLLIGHRVLGNREPDDHCRRVEKMYSYRGQSETGRTKDGLARCGARGLCKIQSLYCRVQRGKSTVTPSWSLGHWSYRKGSWWLRDNRGVEAVRKGQTLDLHSRPRDKRRFRHKAPGASAAAALACCIPNRCGHQ